MQLEKAQSGEAGLAGWISSNDVTLFTMVLVVIIAVFLQNHLVQGKDENARLTHRNEQLSTTKKAVEESLAETQQMRDQLQADLKQRREELRQTNEQLAAARAARDALDGRLKTELDRIAQLNQSLQQLDVEKNTLQKRTSDLTDRQNALAKEKEALARNNDALTKQKDNLARETASLTQEKTSLAKNLAELTATLDAKVQALKDVEMERDHLEEQSKTLDGIIATLQEKLALANSDMQTLKKTSEQRIAEAHKEAETTASEAAEATARADDYLSRLRRAADLFKGMQAERQTLESQVTNLESRYAKQVARDSIINRQLVGLKGKLNRVAFLFDASGSMKRPGSSEDERWAQAQQIANTWLAHLDVDQCVLIVFSSDVHTFPSDGTMLKVRGSENENNRAQLLETLGRIEPAGWTNTLDALRTAYAYEELDTIVLFSDGAPTNAQTGRFDPAVVQQIYTLCRHHEDIPVNTIGLGNYFDENMAAVLRNIASITGGTFRGR